MDSPLILLVEDDRATRSFLAENLSADGYQVLHAENRRHALALLATTDPALVLADVNGETLGLLDAIRTGAGLRAAVDPDTPIIVLTGRADELARVRVFEHDGDDVVTKPFSYPELRGRIRALLRRSQGQQHRRVVRIGTLRVDLGSREAHVDGRPVPLTGKEFDLLAALAKQPTRVVTTEATRAVGLPNRVQDENSSVARPSAANQTDGGGPRPHARGQRVGHRLPPLRPCPDEGGGMRPQTPLDVCAQIASEHAAGTLAAIDKTPAAKLAERLEHYGETLSELAAELAGDRVSDSEEDASE